MKLEELNVLKNLMAALDTARIETYKKQVAKEDTQAKKKLVTIACELGNILDIENEDTGSLMTKKDFQAMQIEELINLIETAQGEIRIRIDNSDLEDNDGD